MTSPDELALASRAEQAGGPDRELDKYLFGIHYGWTTFPLHGDALQQFNDAPLYSGVGTDYTASLDAITALIAEKLPGLSYEAHVSGFGGAWARLWDPRRQPGFCADFPRADAKTPALALCAAFLKAAASTEDCTP